MNETCVAELVFEQLLELVTWTVNDPDVHTSIDCVVAPLLHKYENPDGAESVTVSPTQTGDVADVLMLAVGNAISCI